MNTSSSATSPDDQIKGLSLSQVAESREQHGTNVLSPARRNSPWREFLKKFSDPLIIILLIAGALSVGIAVYENVALGHDWMVYFEPAGIFMAIILATGLAFIFEQKANAAFRILNRVNDDEPVDVIRCGGNTTRVPRRDVVVGDVVVLNTGDEVPADGRLVDAVSLSVDESTLTGEPICHKTTCEAHFDHEATYQSDYVLRGTKVMEGHGVMIVDKVGDSTEMGKVYKDAQIDDKVKTPLNEQLERLGTLITDASYTTAALVIVGQLISFLGWHHWESWLPVVPVALFFWMVMSRFKKWPRSKCVVSMSVSIAVFFGMVACAFHLITPDATDASWSLLLSHTLKTLMVAVTLIVVAVPEGLPMAVTLSLAYSMSRMLKTNNLVRKMHACETMGAATVICTDKTGTLTQNLMQVADARFYGDIPDALINEGIAVNCTATLDLSGDKPKALGNPTEGALLLWLNSRGIDYHKMKTAARRIDELPFTTERKYMASLVESAVSGRPVLYVKGAPEILLGMCSEIAGGTDRAEIERQLLEYQSRAMRTLAFAYSEPANAEGTITPEGIVAPTLTFAGIIAISDPVRDDVPEAVKECLNAGIDVKIVTGDTPATAREIGRRIGLWEDTPDASPDIITGPEFAALSDEEAAARVHTLKIISRARPGDKRRLVETLQRCHEVVAVTGDGTNDAPALNTAHIGLSMGDGTSVAKEASDITIIDNSFSSIGRAVMWGRSLYKNIQRFLLFQLTVNVAACLLVMIGSFIGSESPLTVTQMLWVNLIMDTFGAMALASLPPSPGVMLEKPRNQAASILTRPMLLELAWVGVLFFAITFGLYILFIHSHVTSVAGIFHASIDAAGVMTPYEATLLFSVFVWTHFWYMFDTRTFDTGKSIFHAPLSRGFKSIVLIIVAGQLFITEIAYEFFNVEPMLHTTGWQFNPSGAVDLLIIVATSSMVLWVREIFHVVRSLMRR